MRLRRAFPEDAAAVDRLLERAYPTLMAPSYPFDAFAAALPSLTTANAALLSSGTYYVVQDEVTECLVGCGGWTPERPGTNEIIPGVAHLRHFATDPAFARQGIGRAIFRECGWSAERWGAKLFQAYSSLNAVPFYAALGLVPVRQIELALTPTVYLPSIVMEGPLKTE